MTTKRRPLIAGNWKLHKTIGESVTFARELRGAVAGARTAEVVVAPVFTALRAVADALDGARVGVAAQDVYWEPKGAFTGEVSAPMLVDAGCSYCIVGHSERRQFFGDTDESVGRKAAAALSAGLTPVICVGETLQQRERNETHRVVLAQLAGAYSGLTRDDAARTVVAYEPVWAIGTGRNASPSDAEDVHARIRAWLGERFDAATSDAVRILYGGSVKADNARALLSEPNIDGALVGGASLAIESFVAIVRAAE